ncbi:MAG: elongation factor G [Planctomycetia bacterium]|nr:elongation factor G [Planctomycetia bacterium]
MTNNIQKIRNIGVIAHIDAGKTTVTENMLYYAHFSHRVGQVDEGTTTTDFDEEEQKRGITIYSAPVTFQWKDYCINLIDTPGHVDFTAEVERCLRVLDGAVVVFSAREGVEAQSETVWRQADKYHVPRIAFINKMDREGADFDGTFSEIKRRLEANPVAMTIPVGSGPEHASNPFRAIIDLVEMKMLVYDKESHGEKFDVCPIPEDMQQDAELWRAQMLDELSMHSDELMELLLSEEDVPVTLIHHVVREATIHAMIVPVFCGTALHHIGVQPVLDAILEYLPSPGDVPPVEGMDPQNPLPREPGEIPSSKFIRRADPKEPFCGLVFKIVSNRHGDLYYIRVYSGSIKANSKLLNARNNKKENIPQIWRILADSRELIPEASAGDIIGVIGLRHSVTGDTLCDPKSPIILESIDFPETVISMAIEPQTTAERKKLDEVLDIMRRQDPTFQAVMNQETGQTLISGMGELHLEVIKHKLLRDHKLNVRVRKPRVSFREAVSASVETTGVCNRKVGENVLFAEVSIKVEPNPAADKSVLVIPDSAIIPGCPFPLLEAALQTLKEQGAGGGMFGFPLIRSKITITRLAFNEMDTENDVPVRIAAADAFSKAIKETGVHLMEPIMKVEVTTPDECVGDIVNDLLQRRAVINHTFMRGKNTVIDADAPLENLFGYSNAVRSLSQGRASFTMEPHTYGPAPKEVMDSFT